MIDLNSKHRRKTALLMAAAMSASLFLTACGSDKPVEPTPATATPTTPGTSGTLPGGLISDVPINVTTAPQDTVSGPDASDPATTAEPDPAIPSGVNYLTGLPQADKTINSRRPVAVVFNNLRGALPQHGIGAADVVFEVEAEGGITRIVGIFSDLSAVGTIGSVRSARPVMINIAMGLDCVFAHSGGSPQAYKDLSAYGVTDIDGLYDSGAVFYRDANRSKTMGVEHSLMTTGKRLSDKVQKLQSAGTRMALKDGYTAPFAFNDRDTQPTGGTSAEKVTTKYGSYQPFFRYNQSAGTYQRFEYGAKHMDNETGEQLSFKNVLVLSVKSSVIKGDSSGRRQFSDVGSGEGLYATDGVAVPIKWSKASASAPLKLTCADGSALKLNPGKTFISYVNGIENAVTGN